MKKFISGIAVMLIALSTSSGFLLNAQSLDNNSNSKSYACELLTANGTIDENCSEDSFGIKNGGFEDGGDYWKVTGDHVIWVSSDSAYKGKYYGGFRHNHAIYQEMMVQPGQTVYYSFAHRATSGEQSMYVRGGIGSDIDPANPTIGGKDDTLITVTDNTNWKEYNGTFKIPDDWDPTVPYRIAFIGDDSSWYDGDIDEIHFGTSPIYDNEINASMSSSNVVVEDEINLMLGDTFGNSSKLIITNDQNLKIDPSSIDSELSIISNKPGELVLGNLQAEEEGDNLDVNVEVNTSDARTFERYVKFTSKFEYTSFGEDEVLTEQDETPPVYTVEDSEISQYDARDADGDGIIDQNEIATGLDPDVANLGDIDGDGITDKNEVNIYQTNPLVADTDADTILDKDEIDNGLNPLVANTGDIDTDEISDKDEVNIYETNPLNSDTDGDGITDIEEINLGINPKKIDTDRDGITDKDEIDNGLNPNEANTGDIDKDGLTDEEEVNKYGTNPLNSDTDGDEINDGIEIVRGLDPLIANTETIDTDGDGITDTEETNETHTDPTKADTDGDGITDKDEIDNGLNPHFPNRGDTDGDGITDKDEIANGTNPLVNEQ